MTTSTSPPRTRVLLIDDDELIAGSLRRYLLTQGCDVDVALEPASATKLMASSRYAVVVVDPYLTGEVVHASSALIPPFKSRRTTTAPPQSCPSRSQSPASAT